MGCVCLYITLRRSNRITPFVVERLDHIHTQTKRTCNPHRRLCILAYTCTRTHWIPHTKYYTVSVASTASEELHSLVWPVKYEDTMHHDLYDYVTYKKKKLPDAYMYMYRKRLIDHTTTYAYQKYLNYNYHHHSHHWIEDHSTNSVRERERHIVRIYIENPLEPVVGINWKFTSVETHHCVYYKHMNHKYCDHFITQEVEFTHRNYPIEIEDSVDT